MSTPLIDPERVQNLLLWECDFGAGRYCRSTVTFKNVATTNAEVKATGNLATTAPVAVIALTSKETGLIGNRGALTLVVVDSTSEGVTLVGTVLTVYVNITAGSHNTITLMNVVINASALFGSTVSSGGSGTITASTVGAVTMAGGKDAVVTPTKILVGTPLIFNTDHHEVAVTASTGSVVAIGLADLNNLTLNQIVNNYPVVAIGPLLINQDEIKRALAAIDTNASLATVMSTILALKMKPVLEPTKITTAT